MPHGISAMMRSLPALAVVVVFPLTAAAQASTVVSGGFSDPFPVSSYSMLNGGVGGYQYLDYIYPSPNATVPGAWLSGGTGLLTDGIGATQSWNEGAENPLGGYQGQFVGWFSDNMITFYFDAPAELTHMRVDYDISGEGGVGPPGPISVDGYYFTTTLPDEGTEPFWADYDLTGLPISANDPVYFTRDTGDPWLMISEVEFSVDTATPEPGSLVLLATGLAGLVAMARRRGRHARPQ